MAQLLLPPMRDDWSIQYHNPVFGSLFVALRLSKPPVLGDVLRFQHVANRVRYSVVGTVELVHETRRVYLSRFGLKVEVVK